MNYHNEIKAAFGVVSRDLTGQQLFGGMMTHQKRANAVLTTVNSCSGLGHLCACPASCRNSPLQTSIRRRRLQKQSGPDGNAGGVCQRRSGSAARRLFGGHEEKLCLESASFRSINYGKHLELALRTSVELHRFQWIWISPRLFNSGNAIFVTTQQLQL